MNKIAMFLARYTLLDEVLAIGLYSWPIVTDS